MRAPSCTLPQ